jgi:UDP-hydrolysing UDP-N-acetyl-D-glucosamine 2-epimerase
MMRRILSVTGTRADYGLMHSVYRHISGHPSLSLELAVTGMHLLEEFGSTLDEIKKDGYRYHIIESTPGDDTKEAMVLFIGDFLQKFTLFLSGNRPDILLLVGDRGEMLGAAIAGAYLGIPVAHIHGGEITSTVDEYARHAITKLANLHFAATPESGDRIVRMGEDPSGVFVVGAPGLDRVLGEPLLPPDAIARKYALTPGEPLILVVQHPVSLDAGRSAFQMEETLEAIAALSRKTILIYPNADAGGRAMIEVIERYKGLPFLQIYKSLPSRDYLSLLSIASVLIGNSSSGIIEAPSFCLPVVNLGTRQQGRQRAGNVIDVDHDRMAIRKAVERALSDEEFRRTVRTGRNPYGDGKAGVRIAATLALVKIGRDLLGKQITY